MGGFGWFVGCIALDIGVIITNICEQVYILKGWKSLDRIDHLLLSLSFSDLVNGVASLSVDAWVLEHPEILSNGTGRNGHNITAVSHQKVVKHIFDTVFLFTVFSSVLHVTAVAIERIYAVRFPRKYYIFTKFKTKCATIILIWIIPLILTPSFALCHECTESTSGRLIRGNALAIIMLSVFVIYCSVAYFLFRQSKSVMDDFGDTSTVQVRKLRRLTLTCIFIGISFVVCIAPMTIGHLYEPFSHEISSVMVTLNSIINPFIYFIKVYQNTRHNNKCREYAEKEAMPQRAYGYTLTTIVDENECREQCKLSPTLRNGCRAGESPAARNGSRSGESPLTRGGSRIGESPMSRKLLVRESPMLRHSPMSHDSLLTNESPQTR